MDSKDVKKQLNADWTGKMIMFVLYSHPQRVATWNILDVDLVHSVHKHNEDDIRHGMQIKVDTGVFKGYMGIYYDEATSVFFLLKSERPLTLGKSVMEMAGSMKNVTIVPIQQLVPTIDRMIFQR